MKGLKKYYQNNRVFIILMTIVLICLIVMGISLINYFYGGKNSTVYGNRLDGIEKVEISESRQSEIKAKLTSEEMISDASMMITGKIIYFRIEFTEAATLVEAQSKAISTLDNFSEEEKNFYDFHFTLKQEASTNSPGFIISGAKNVNGTNVVWNNNVEVKKEQ